METEYRGHCYCGATTITVKGEATAAAYCHCYSCRKWHAAPINAWAVWPTDKVTITGQTITSDQSAESARISCRTCGGCVANGKPSSGLVVVYPMTLAESGWTFTPAFHIFYGERVMDVNDGLPKYVDAPRKFGHSGEKAEEPSLSAWKG